MVRLQDQWRPVSTHGRKLQLIQLRMWKGANQNQKNQIRGRLWTWEGSAFAEICRRSHGQSYKGWYQSA